MDIQEQIRRAEELLAFAYEELLQNLEDERTTMKIQLADAYLHLVEVRTL